MNKCPATKKQRINNNLLITFSVRTSTSCKRSKPSSVPSATTLPSGLQQIAVMHFPEKTKHFSVRYLVFNLRTDTSSLTAAKIKGPFGLKGFYRNFVGFQSIRNFSIDPFDQRIKTHQNSYGLRSNIPVI